MLRKYCWGAMLVMVSCHRPLLFVTVLVLLTSGVQLDMTELTWGLANT